MNGLGNIKGIMIAVITFSILHYSMTYFANRTAVSQDGYSSLITYLNVAATINYFICGMLAGALHGRNFISTGMITGALCALSAITLFGVSYNDGVGMFITITTGVILGGLGGSLSMLIKSRLRNAL